MSITCCGAKARTKSEKTEKILNFFDLTPTKIPTAKVVVRKKPVTPYKNSYLRTRRTRPLNADTHAANSITPETCATLKNMVEFDLNGFLKNHNNQIHIFILILINNTPRSFA
jgi:hypothetical protein